MPDRSIDRSTDRSTEQLIARFLREYSAYDQVSEERRTMQTRVLREYAASVGDDLLDAGADGTAMRAFLAAELERGLKPTTVRKHLNAVRPFYTWAWRAKLIGGDRLMELRDVAPPRGSSTAVPKPYKKAEIERFWHDLRAKYPWTRRPPYTRDHAEFYVRRWRAGQSRWKRVQPYAWRLQITAIATLAMHGGLRREEIFNLQIDDMAPEGEYVVVRGAAKNEEARNRDRAVPWMSDYMRTAVREWLEFRETIDTDHDRPWLSLWTEEHYAKPLRFRKFEVLMRGIGRGYEYHRMRHTAATEWLRAGMPIERVSKILGHRRIQQTLEYAELIHRDVVAAAARAAPAVSRALNPPEELIA